MIDLSSRARRAVASLLLLSTTSTFALTPTLTADPATAGREQGVRDSTGEGRRLGRTNGLSDGEKRGHQDGLADCAAEMRAEAQRKGGRQGDRDGAVRGSEDASIRGLEDGKRKGAIDGAADGDARSNQQAQADATPKGTADGIAEANQTDAAVRGAADGKIAGNIAAKSDAESFEYSPARAQYRDERYAEPIRSESTLPLSAQAIASAKRGYAQMTSSTSSLGAELFAGPGNPTLPNVKPVLAAEKAIAHCKASTPAGAPATDFEKCVDAYKPAYEISFNATFKSEYLDAYRIGFDQKYAMNKAQGCEVARRGDYRHDYDLAYRRSYDESYRIAFDRVFRTAFDRAYRAEFATASAATFDANYAGHYQAHYAASKAAAFRARQNALYGSAHAAAKSAEFAARYPGYKKEVVARGRADEAAEFARLPVRLIGIKLRESIPDGIQEPGEKLTVDLDLRNFADAGIAARDLDIRAVARTSGIALPGSIVILPKDLAAKSLNHLIGALDIRLDESAIGKPASVEIQISVRGNRLATETIQLTAQTLASIVLLETPVVRLGYPGAVRVRVTNRSSLAMPESVVLGLSTNMQGVVFGKTSEAMSALGAGESRDVSFPFSAENYTGGQAVSFVASLNLDSGRRIGILNESREVPMLQDYAFRMRGGIFDGDISDLRKSGKTRVKVFVKNVGARQATQTLSLTASIRGPNAANFQFVKGNQVVFDPLAPGQEADGDKIVVKAKNASSGGTFVLEVREGGKLIGIYQETF